MDLNLKREVLEVLTENNNASTACECFLEVMCRDHEVDVSMDTARDYFYELMEQFRNIGNRYTAGATITGITRNIEAYEVDAFWEAAVAMNSNCSELDFLYHYLFVSHGCLIDIGANIQVMVMKLNQILTDCNYVAETY